MVAKTNKCLIVFLIIIGILAIFLGYIQIKGAIYAPFKQVIVEEPELPSEAEIFSFLSAQDTDKDGLSDFDERFVYQTSVYIFDSDGDSFSDKEEVEAQSDPLNPESNPYRIDVPEKPSPEQTFSLSKYDILNETISIEEIRNLLINEAGLSQEIVDKLDDKTLENLYNETKQETGIDLEQLTAPNDQERQFSDLTPSQIKQLLIEQGSIDESMLDSIDDETLKSMFLQSLLDLE